MMRNMPFFNCNDTHARKKLNHRRQKARKLLLLKLQILLAISFCSCCGFCDAISSSSTMTMTNNAASSLKPIKRVAIIGSGICGLSLAHALTNNSCRNSATSSTTTVTTRGGDDEKIDVCLYDSREFLDCKSGAGVQLTGGLSALKKINPALYREVYDTGLPLKTIRSRAKPWFTSTSSNKSDGDFSTLLELGLEETIKKAGGDTRKKLITLGKDGKGEEVMATAIMRGALQETLFKNLPKETSDNVKFGKTLVGIKPAKAAATEGKGGIICVFEDGSEDGPFDMVVGSDGINSAVKEYVDTGNITIDGKKRETTIYSGIRIQYAVQDGQPEDEQKDSAELVQYFGDAAYSLAGLYGVGKNKKPTKAAYLIFKDKNYIGTIKKIRKTATRQEPSENSDWNQETESVGSLMYSRMKDCGVPDQQVGPIIQNSDRFFELGVYFHNPFSFNGWSREVRGNGNGGNCYAVLAGDAAHAMPPFLGQGANQAVQDSYCLATTIFQHNDDIRRRLSTDNKCLSVEGELKRELSLRILLKEYERKRWVPTASITFKSIFLGYLETGEDGFLSKFRDSFFKVAGKVGIAQKVFLDAATPKF